MGGGITPPDYPTLFFFEVGQWWDYAMLLLVVALLAGAAWLAQRNMWVVLALFVVVPIALTIFWWPHSTAGTASAGWFPIMKQYSALAGSLCLVALQVFPRLRHNRWYLIIPPAILAVNIAEAVVRDFQCYGIHGVDPAQGMVTWGGPWNIMNGVAGILNLLAISGWVGIFVSKGKERALIWGDLTIGWIIAYDLWNLAYVYNCLADRAWYSGMALLASCTIPALMKVGRGAWIQYRAYTLTLWSRLYSRSRTSCRTRCSPTAAPTIPGPCSSSRRPPWWRTRGCSPRTCARSSPNGVTRSRRRSTPTRPPTPRGSVTSRPMRTRSLSPRAWARRRRRQALHRRTVGKERQCYETILRSVLCRSENSDAHWTHSRAIKTR